MPDYGSYCPVAMASEVIADRWNPLIIRELVLGNTRFNDIARGMPGISRSLLVQRLRHLERRRASSRRGRRRQAGAASTTSRRPGGTGACRRQLAAGPSSGSSTTCARRRASDNADVVDAPTGRPVALPPQRTVIEFRHTAPDPQTIWMVLDHGEASVCLQHPGFESDVVATASTAAFADVFQGYQRWSEAVDAGRIEVAGPRRLASALSTWFRWSPWAPVTRERADRAATGPYAAETATRKRAPQHSAQRTPPSVPT